MPEIVVEEALQSVISFLPESNVIEEEAITSIIEGLILTSLPANDTQYLGELICKSLRSVAVANKLKWNADSKGVRREELGGAEIEFFESSSSDPWGSYIKSLSEFCPLVLNYTPDWGLNIGIKISSGKKIEIGCQKHNKENLHL